MDTDDVPIEHGENASESAVQSLLLLSSTHSQKSSPSDDEKKESCGSPGGITIKSASSSSRRVGIPEDISVPNFSGMLPIPLTMEAFVNGSAGLSNNGFVVVPQHFVTNGGMNNHPPGFFIPIHSSFGAVAGGPSSLLLQRSLSSEVGEYMMPNRPPKSNSSSSSSSSGAAAAAGGNAPMEKKLVLFEGLKAMQAKEYPVNEMLFARSLALQYHDSSSGGPPGNVPPQDPSTDNLPVGHLDFLVQQQQQQLQQQPLQQQPQPPQFMHQNQMQSRAHATHDDASGNNSMSSNSSKKRLNSGTSSVKSFDHDYAGTGAGGSGTSEMGKKHRGSDLSLGSLNFSGKSFTSLTSGFPLGTNMNFFPEGVTMYDPLSQGGFAQDTRSSGISGSMSLGGSFGGLSDSTKQLVAGAGLMLPPMPPGEKGMNNHFFSQSRPSPAAAASSSSSSSSSSNMGTTKVLSFGPINGRKNEHDMNGIGSAAAACDNNDVIGTTKLKHQKTSAERYRQRNSRRKQSFSSKLTRVVSMLRMWIKRGGVISTDATGTSSSSSNGMGVVGVAVTTKPLAAAATGGAIGGSSSGSGMYQNGSIPMMSSSFSSRTDIPPTGGPGGDPESFNMEHTGGKRI